MLCMYTRRESHKQVCTADCGDYKFIRQNMAVVLTLDDGCVLDHEQAIISAYNQCNFPPTFLPSLPQLCVDDNRDGDEIKNATDISSEDALQCFGSVSGYQQCLTRTGKVDNCHECACTASKHWTSTSKEDIRVEGSSALASEHVDSLLEHFVQPASHKKLLRQCKGSICEQKHVVNSAVDTDVKKRENASSQSQCSAETLNSDSKEPSRDRLTEMALQGQTDEMVKYGSAASNLVNERMPQVSCLTDTCQNETALCKGLKKKQQMEARFEQFPCNNTNLDHSQTGLLYSPKLKKLSLRLKPGFFAVKVPFMMDSQFEKVNDHFAQKGDVPKEYRKQIDVTDILQLLQSKQRKRKSGKMARNTEEPEEALHKAHRSLVLSAREQGLFLKHVPLPLDNNLLSRQLARLDGPVDVFTSLLVASESAPVLHMWEGLTPLVIQGGDCTTFSATDLIHRRICHKNTEASLVDVDGTGYVLPPCSQFLMSNLQDLSDHLFLELDENDYDLIVMDPPWENKSVKRKKTYNMMSEEELQRLPLSRLTRPAGLVAVWVTNNQRLEDYCLHTLFPLWGLTALARWHWIKVTQTGDMISSTEGHKKPYEVLLLARASGTCGDREQGRKDVPERRVMMSVPCSLHSKKPPLADILQPYLPSSPKCLELFARNLWPGWTSWGREVLKHQNLIFYDVIDNTQQSGVIKLGSPLSQQD